MAYGHNKIKMTGLVFGKILIQQEHGRDSSGSVTYLCLCVCGKEFVSSGSNIRKGNTKSCGCFQKEKAAISGKKNKTHGMSNTNVYKVWRAMINRCTNKNVKKFEHHGGRGISVCERWRNSFENFISDMGERPDGLSLDRIDNDGNYEPKNCRWATYSEQNKNRRKFKKKEK